MNWFAQNWAKLAWLVLGSVAVYQIYLTRVDIDTTSKSLLPVTSQATDTLKAGATVIQSVAPVLDKLSITVDKANTAMDKVLQPCVPGPCGTLADINKTLGTFRSTLGQIEVAANHEDRNLGKFDDQETELFSNLNGVLGGIPAIETRFSDELTSLNTTTNDFNSFILSPDVVQTTHNLNVFSSNLGLVSTDIQKKTHEFLYPAPCAGKICWLKRAYTIGKDLAPMSEPLYWGVETWKVLK